MDKTASPIVDSKLDDGKESKVTEVLSEMLDKVIIKLPELTSIDPLEYFSRFLDIPETILNHLSGKDLMGISEVTPSWYNFIASSKTLMQKVKVVFDRDFDYNEGDLVRISDISPNYYESIDVLIDGQKALSGKCTTHSEDYNLLKNSSRLFQDIKIQRRFLNIKDENGNRRELGDYVTNSELDVFCSKAHEWKNVQLENIYFRNKLDFYKLLSSIQTSVEDIYVRDFGFLSLEDPSSEIELFEALKFPKLNGLTVHLYDNSSIGNTLARFLLNSTAIKELAFLDLSGTVDKSTLTKMLENFVTLKCLRLFSTILNEIFEDESWQKFQFKLNWLEIIIHSELNINFRNFLQSQSELEKLAIDADEINRETIDVIMKLPKLNSVTLSFKFFEAFPENEVPIKKSTSINELTVFGSASAIMLKNLLDSMPKVKNLNIFRIDEEILEILKSMKRKFKKLKVCKLEGVDRKEVEEIMTKNYISLEIVESKKFPFL